MFEQELSGLTQFDQVRIRGLIESATKELLVAIDTPGIESQQLFLKCAILRSVFKLASAIRRNTSAS